MPAKNRTATVKRYDEKHGLKTHAYKLKATDTEAFKSACAKNGESQAAALTRFMKSYTARSLGKTQTTKELEQLTALCAEQQRQLEEMKRQLEATAQTAENITYTISLAGLDKE